MGLRKHRLLLSAALVAGCLWCLEQVRLAQASRPTEPPAAVNRQPAPPSRAAAEPPEGSLNL